MARFNYDVNTTTRYIDIHKQFNGGLKTVDTDDALGAVFLRQAENVSLSEFGFIEKRYGTFENFKIHTNLQETDKLQGYWEFYPEQTLYIVYAINGEFYVNGNKVTEYFEEKEEYRFPDFATKFEWTKNELIWTDVLFQTTKEIGGIIKNDVMYFFTGTYPVYAMEVTEEVLIEGVTEEVTYLKFFLLPIEVPTYDEIVVVGHNLLENDYEQVYGFTTPNDYDTGSAFYSPTSGAKPELTKIDYYPRIPFQENDGEKGNLNFSIDYTLPSSTQLAYPSLANYKRLSLEAVRYRNSGSGASSFDFVNVDLENVDFEDIDNDNSNIERTTLDEGFYYDKIQLISSELDVDKKTINVGSDTFYVTNYTLEIEEDFPKTYIDNNKDFVFKFFTYDPNLQNPFEAVVFEDLIVDNQLNNFTSEFYIEVTPYDLNNTPLEKSKITISSEDIDKTYDQYRFTIPANIFASDFVSGYKIKFYDAFEVGHQPATESDSPYGAIDFYKTFAAVQTLPSARNFSDEPLLDFSISDLLSGTFDFEIVFSLKQYNEQDGFLTLRDEKQFSNILYNVTITPEKLQDYPGPENVPTKLKALWTCNRVIEHFNKLMVWGSTLMPNSVFYSFPDRPAYFPSKFYLDFGSEATDPVMAVTPYMNILVVQTLNTTWGIRGNSGYIDSPAPYNPFSINNTVGTIAPNSVKPIRNHLFFLSKQGVIALKSLYAADEQYNIEFMDRNIRNIVRQDPEAVGIQFDNQYWLNFPNFGITLRWYIDKKAWVQDIYTTWVDFNGVFKYQIVNGLLEFITHPSQFEAEDLTHTVYKIGIDYSLPYDLGKTFETKFETSYLNQNYPFHPKTYKEAKLDFTLQNEYNLSRDAIYEMETNEHILNNSIHTINNVSLLKNHTYKMFYTFGTFVVENLEGGSFDETFEAYDAGNFNLYPADVGAIDGYTFSPNTNLRVDSVQITNKDNEENIYLSGDDIVITELENSNYTVGFYIPHLIPSNIVDVILHGDFEFYDGGAVMYDVTYDDTLTFNTWILSEEGTLNFDNIESYDQAKAEVGFSLQDRLGEWVFGSSDFGNKVTAVKTIKLSGKGYNAKIYMEDLTNSKWTLESLGITYKMKRARSR